MLYFIALNFSIIDNLAAENSIKKRIISVSKKTAR